MTTESTFQYLNLENKWPMFQLTGLTNEAGALSLVRIPGNPVDVSPPLDVLPAHQGPAGISIDSGGNLYLADLANHQILRVDACDGRTHPLPCLHGPGSEPGQLNAPRGLIVGPRHALYIADSGNHRIVVVDLSTLQIRAIWGQPDPYAPPEPSTDPGRFDEPWDLASDQAEFVYVVDHGNRRLQKFTANGTIILGFWETVQTSFADSATWEPVSTSTIIDETEEHLLVIDRAANRLLIFDLDGTFDAAATARWADVATQVAMPIKAISDGAFLYVADAATGNVIVFDITGNFVGVARNQSLSIAGLTLDHQGQLVIHPGGGAAVQQLQPAIAHVECGTFLAGPFTTDQPRVQWQRLHAMADPVPSGSHVQLFVYTSATMDGSPGNVPSAPALCSDLAGNISPTTDWPLDTWHAAPADALDFLIPNEDGPYLWLAGLMQGDGGVSPTLHQIRLEYNQKSWTEHLPAVYQRDATTRTLLDPALALFQSMRNDKAAIIDGLPRLFDPWAAPNAHAPDSWLDWLAGWLAFDMDETWTETQRREALAAAFAAYSRRGTRESLRDLILLYAGATAHIEEPGRFASLWSLGETSVLGFDTMLAPAHAQGAVVGTTATLSQSHLIQEADYGAPVFEDVAHRFCVQVYAADTVDAEVETKVHRILAREKPAHTSYHLCLIEPRMRVGFQARIGIDTIIAGPPPDMVLASPSALGFDTVLPDRDPAAHAAIGQGARIGSSTKVS